MKSVYQIAIYAFLFWYTIEPCYGQKYFQQEVEYSIDAQLDTSANELKVECTIRYTNNSQAVLDTLLFHLWWNALSDKQSAFATQFLAMGLSQFHFSADSEMGAYFDLNIADSGGHLLKYEKYRNHPDIIHIALENRLNPGETAELKFDYWLKIPYAFSRFGLIENTYQFTQWYPKPAVYDREGWHPMPYLSFGEFYSEFGDFEVSLHVPQHMKLGYTGVLSKRQFTDIGMLYHIKAEKVHDFAWFGSTDFVVEKDVLNSGTKKVDIEVLHKGKDIEWVNAMSYAKESLLFFSKQVGEYPYPKLTVVQGSKSNNGAMEYPMITIVDGVQDGPHLDHLINHEIGHNWFYGILASNERDHAWIDEGLTSFYDHKYFSEKYKRDAYDDLIPSWYRHDHAEYALIESLVIQMQNINRDLPVGHNSEDNDILNYLSNNYEKMSMALSYLESYLSKALFNQAIKVFYNRWKFKHPGPSDLQRAFEEVSGKDLDWFFFGLIRQNKRIDYKILQSSVKDDSLNIKIKNNGNLIAPFEISLYDKDNTILFRKWYEGLELGETRDLVFHIPQVHRVSVNGESVMIEINRRNNHHHISSVFPAMEPIKFKWGLHAEDSRVNEIHFLPAINFNVYDGLMTGAMLSNTTFPTEDFRWFANVTYGFESKKISGIFNIEKDFINQRKNFRKISIGLEGRRFDNSSSDNPEYHIGYWKLVPKLGIHFSDDIFTNFELSYKAHIYNQEYLLFLPSNYVMIENFSGLVHQLNLSFENRRRLSHNNGYVRLEYESYNPAFNDRPQDYLKLSMEWNKNIRIGSDARFFARFYGAGFIHNTERNSSNYSDIFVRSSIALTAQGFNDYTYDNLYFGRMEQTGLLSRQIDNEQGGFKNGFGSSQKIGMSNDYAVMLNFKTDIPVGFLAKSGLRPYLDLALSSTKGFDNDPLENIFYYSAGLAWEFGDVFGIYLPLIHSDEIRQAYSGSNLLSRISFKINFEQFNLWNLADNPGQLVD